MTPTPDNITMPFGDEETSILGEGVEAVSECWIPTGRLKFVRTPNHHGGSAARILHQEWADTFSGKTEWRVVPEEEA
jgi:hypothetical protein